MMRRTVITLTFFLAFSSGILYAGEPVIRAFPDKKEIGVGEKIKVTVEMEWKQDKGPSLIIEKITPPSSDLLRYMDSFQSASTRLGQGGVFVRKRMEYIYSGKEKGAGDIEPAVIEYTFSDNRENVKIIKSEPIPVKVVSVPARAGRIILKSVFIALILFLLSGVFILIKKRFIDLRADGKDTGGDRGEAEKKFLDKLKELDKYKVSGDREAYYAGIEKSLSDYIEEKYSADLSAGNTGKFPEELQKICDECGFLTERVRFSGYKPQESEENKLIRGIKKYMKSLIRSEGGEESVETIGPVSDKAR